MSAEETQKTGLSREAWSAIAAIAVALITGAVTLVTHFASPDETPSAAASPLPVTAPSADVTADAIAGRWAGRATDADGVAFEIGLELAQGCALAARCGTISVSHVPCRGAVYLAAVQQGDYEFRVDDFEPPSAAGCTAGAGEHFRLAPDGTLLYRTTYDPRAQGTLTRQD